MTITLLSADGFEIVWFWAVLVLQAVYVKSLVDIATGRAAGWNYVPREAGNK